MELISMGIVKCPFCGEINSDLRIDCLYCGKFFTLVEGPPKKTKGENDKESPSSDNQEPKLHDS
jgi:hypothetical protein